MAGHTNNPTAIRNNQKAELAVSAIDSFDIGTIFAMFLKDTLQALLESYLKYILFPVAAAGNIIKATLAWRQVALERDKHTGKLKTNLIVRASVETAVATAISLAVLLALAFASVLSSIPPIIFAGTLAVKSGYHALAAVYYAGKASFAPDEESKADCKKQVYGNSVASISGGLVSLAVTLVMILAKPALAPIGIAAGIIGGAFALYRLFTLIAEGMSTQKNVQASTSESENHHHEDGPDHALTNNASLHQHMQNVPPFESAVKKPVVKEVSESMVVPPARDPLTNSTPTPVTLTSFKPHRNSTSFNNGPDRSAAELENPPSVRKSI